MTRATVTMTSSGVMVIRLRPMRTKLGMANAGIPSAGAKCDSTSQTTTKIRSEMTVWRENVPARPASRYSSGYIEDLVVRHLLVESGLHRAIHHVHDRLTNGRVPGRLHDHVESLAVHGGREDAWRQLDGVGGDLVGGVGLIVEHFGHVLQGGEQHLGTVGCAL